MRVYDVIQRPILSEKAQRFRAYQQVYFFFVHLKATKQDVRRAVESLWDVKVKEVHTSILRGKPVRRGLKLGTSSKRKKAMVTLHEGDVIDVFEA